jgi:cold shock protein
MQFSGTVQSFDEIHGNGYILPDNGSERLKFTYRSIQKQGFRILSEGQRVNFETEQNKYGMLKAVNINVISE